MLHFARVGGEVPCIPDALNSLSRDYARSSGLGKTGGAGGVARDPLVLLPGAVFRLMQCSLQLGLPVPPSPILVRQLMWFTERWLVTYIMPNLDDYSKPLSLTLTR